MALETTVILRTILYQLKNSKTLEEAISAVEVMCTKDDISAVEQQLSKQIKP